MFNYTEARRIKKRKALQRTDTNNFLDLPVTVDRIAN